MNNNLNFIIIGERRAGSTTLYHLLKQHPQITMASQVDLDFFVGRNMFGISDLVGLTDDSWESVNDYDQFIQSFNGLAGIVGKKDADLFWWKNSHPRMAKYLPKSTKFILVLRNPVKRAESQYWNEYRKGRETLTFEDALRREEEESLSPWQKLHLQYKERGCYINSLTHFKKYFLDENLHIVILENLLSDRENEMEKLCQFLQVDIEIGKTLVPIKSNAEEVPILNPKWKWGWFFIKLYDKIGNSIIKNVSKDNIQRKELRQRFLRFGKISARESNPVPDHVLKNLQTFYLPYNLELEKLTGLDLSKW